MTQISNAKFTAGYERHEWIIMGASSHYTAIFVVLTQAKIRDILTIQSHLDWLIQNLAG